MDLWQKKIQWFAGISVKFKLWNMINVIYITPMNDWIHGYSSGFCPTYKSYISPHLQLDPGSCGSNQADDNNKKRHLRGSFPSYDPLNRRTLTVTSAETNQQVSLTVWLEGKTGHSKKLEKWAFLVETSTNICMLFFLEMFQDGCYTNLLFYLIEVFGSSKTTVSQ